MKNICLTLFAFLPRLVLAQLPCGTPNLSRTQEVENQQLTSQILSKKAAHTEGVLATTYLAIRLHFISDNSGATVADLNATNNGLALLNKHFAPMNVQWYLSGSTPNYILNTAAYNGTFTNTQRDAMTDANNALNAHNIYFAYSLGGAAGYSFGMTQNRTNNRTFLLYGYENSMALPHELGHYMNLAHPHNNSGNATISASAKPP